MSFTHMAQSSDAQSFKHSMLTICSELHPHGTVEWRWGANCYTLTCCCTLRYGGEPSTSPAGQAGGCHHACVGQTSRTTLLPGRGLQGFLFCFLSVHLDNVFCGLACFPSSQSLPRSLFQYLDICCCLWHQFNYELQEFWCQPSQVTKSWFG